MLGSIGINGLSVYAEAGLVIFMAVFVAVTVRAIRAPRVEVRGFAELPLDKTSGGASDTNERRGAL